MVDSMELDDAPSNVQSTAQPSAQQTAQRYTKPEEWYKNSKVQNRYNDTRLKDGWGLNDTELRDLKDFLAGMKSIVNPEGEEYRDSGKWKRQQRHFDHLTRLNPGIIPLVSRAPRWWTIIAVTQTMNRTARNPGSARRAQSTPSATVPDSTNGATTITGDPAASQDLATPSDEVANDSAVSPTIPSDENAIDPAASQTLTGPIDSGYAVVPYVGPATPNPPQEVVLRGVSINEDGQGHRVLGKVTASFLRDNDGYTNWAKFKSEAEHWPGFHMTTKVFAVTSPDWDVPITYSGGLAAAIEDAREHPEHTLLLTSKAPSEQYVPVEQSTNHRNKRRHSGSPVPGPNKRQDREESFIFRSVSAVLESIEHNNPLQRQSPQPEEDDDMTLDNQPVHHGDNDMAVEDQPLQRGIEDTGHATNDDAEHGHTESTVPLPDQSDDAGKAMDIDNPQDVHGTGQVLNNTASQVPGVSQFTPINSSSVTARGLDDTEREDSNRSEAELELDETDTSEDREGGQEDADADSDCDIPHATDNTPELEGEDEETCDGEDEVEKPREEPRLDTAREGLHTQDLRCRLARVNRRFLALVAFLIPFLSEASLLSSAGISLIQWGLNRKFKAGPFQIVAVALMIYQESGLIEGGILGDEMGLGKTLITILCFVMRTLRHENYREVLREWESTRKKETPPTPLRHLPSTETSKRARCPSRNSLAVACWCEPRVREHLRPPQRGSTLFVVPSIAHGAFYSEMAMLFDPAEGSTFLKTHGIRIVFYTGANPSAKMRRTFELYPFLSADEAGVYCRSFDVDSLTRKYQANHAIYTNSAKQKCKRDWHCKPSGMTDVRPLDDKGKSDLLDSASRLLVVTTSGCYPSFKKVGTYSTTAIGSYGHSRPISQDFSASLFVFSQIHVDEFHDGASQKRQLTIFEDAASGCKATGLTRVIWATSGTPDGNNLMLPLAFCTDHMNQSRTWETAEGAQSVLQRLASKGSKELLNIGTRLNNALRKRDVDIPKVLQSKVGVDVHRLLQSALPLLMIRRPLNMEWYDGRKIIVLDAQLIVDIVMVKPYPGEAVAMQEAQDELTATREHIHAEAMKQWEEGGANPSEKPAERESSSIHGYSTAFATASVAPMVAWWKDNYESEARTHPFTTKAPALQRLREGSQTRHWAKIVVPIMAGSSKWAELRSTLDRIKKERRKVADPDNPGQFLDGGPRKVLIVSTWPIIAAIFHCLLEATYPGEVVEYLSRTSPEQREDSLIRFNEDDKVWIMMASWKTVEVGVNLQVASVQIQLNPCGSNTRVAQLTARHYRQGQRDDIVRVICFVMDGSEYEMTLARGMANGRSLRERIMGGAATVSAAKPAPVVVEEDD